MLFRSITDQSSWNNSRNQQRNWETLTQLISMRANLSELSEPQQYRDTWSFEFEVETPDVFGPPENPVAVLLADAEGVPMINNLKNTQDLAPVLRTQTPGQNIWFIPISINN